MTPEQMTEYVDNVRKQCMLEIDAMNASGYGRDGEPPENLHLSDIVEKWIVSPLFDKIASLQGKLDEEHRRRCDLERRFDRRTAGGVLKYARDMSMARSADTTTERMLRTVLTDVILVAEARAK